MKQVIIKPLILFILVIISNFCFTQVCEIWVSPNGNNHNNGTIDAPLQTIDMAQRKARELRRLNNTTIKDGIHIILKDGVYKLDETILIRPEDSGTKDSPTTVKNAEGASPVISGGIRINGWKLLKEAPALLPKPASGKIWVANLPEVGGNRLNFRQMWVNNKKAIRASTLNDGQLNRIISVDKQNEALYIPIPAFPVENTGQLEFVIHQWWAIANLRVKNIETSDGKAKVTFHQPESRIEFEHPWPAPFIDEQNNLNGNSAFYFVNSIALLNSPGEWYADVNNGKIYYWPRTNEDLKNAEVIVPFLETLVSYEGTLDNPVSYFNFEGIRFEHTAWMRPSLAGHVPLQAGMFIYDAYKLTEPGTQDKTSLENQAWTGRQPAAIQFKNTCNNQITDCKIHHLAATGIDFISGTNQNLVKGCVLSDIGGTAVQIGFFGSRSFEAHLPYNPVDEREICHHETISNNLITNATNEDWGCVGISVGYASDILIEHNEVSHLNYSGICVGWGWTKTINCMKNNRVHANYIHHFAKNLYDVGGIYTLSAQPNSEISENRIERLEKAPYAHIPDHYQYIYFDEGSSYIRAVDNWTEKDKFFSNTPGPGNEWKNNGPQVSFEIKDNAGLISAYKHLQTEYNNPGFPFK